MERGSGRGKAIAAKHRVLSKWRTRTQNNNMYISVSGTILRLVFALRSFRLLCHFHHFSKSQLVITVTGIRVREPNEPRTALDSLELGGWVDVIVLERTAGCPLSSLATLLRELVLHSLLDLRWVRFGMYTGTRRSGAPLSLARSKRLRCATRDSTLPSR